jgi:putative tryptophan/tyrosine transport system substrate-binding protein
MRRRDFIALLGAAMSAWPTLTVHAQQADPARRIGVLMSLAESDGEGQRWLSIFRQGLQELNWVEGRNLDIQYRWAAGNLETARAYAAALTALKPDVILAQSTTALIALKEATATIPIVFVNVTDPVGMGFVASLARPGGNITGFSNYEPLMVSKWLEILKEISPKLTRLLVVWHPPTTPSKELGSVVETTAKSFAVRVSISPVRNTAEVESVMTAFGREPGGGVLVLPGSFTTTNRDLIARLALSNRLPAVYPFPYFVTSGGLASYGSDTRDLFRRSASYVDRILKGTRPADLPVQMPTKFELVINLKAAKAIGLEVSQSLLARADEVIE